MTQKTIELSQRKIERAIKKIHPDNPLIFEMQKRYRELERLKE